MENHTKEFRIGDYLGVFEKSLNYMTGTVFAAFIAGVSWYVSEPDRRAAFPQMIHTLHEDPKKLLCLVTALLSVLPYYFYYTLKDITNWNMYGNRGDHKGLPKVGILYEICSQRNYRNQIGSKL